MKRQRGFSAALVLIIMVLLGGMLAYAVTLTSGMHSGLAQEIAHTRTQQAARTGLEWGRYRIRIGAAPSCVAATNLTVPFSSGAMPVTVRCTLTGTYLEGATTVRTYQLRATSCSPAAAGACPNAAGSADYVESSVSGNEER